MPVVVIQAFGVFIFVIGSMWLASEIRRSGSRGVAEQASRISHSLFWIALVLPGTIGLFYPGLRSYDELFGMPSLPMLPISGPHQEGQRRRGLPSHRAVGHGRTVWADKEPDVVGILSCLCGHRLDRGLPHRDTWCDVAHCAGPCHQSEIRRRARIGATIRRRISRLQTVRSVPPSTAQQT